MQGVGIPSGAQAAILMVAPSLIATLIGLAMTVPMLVRHFALLRAGLAPRPA